MGNFLAKKSTEPVRGEEKGRPIYRAERVKETAKAGDRRYPLSPGRERTELPTSKIHDICSQHGPLYGSEDGIPDLFSDRIIREASKEDASNLKRGIRPSNTKSDDHLVKMREMWRSQHEDQQDRVYSFSKVTSEEDTSNLKRGIQPHDTKSSDDIMVRKKLHFLLAQDGSQSFSNLRCIDPVRASRSKTRMLGLSVNKTAENQTLVRNTKNMGYEDLPSSRTRCNDLERVSSSKTGMLGLSVDKTAEYQSLMRNTKNMANEALPSRHIRVTSEEYTSNSKREIQPCNTKSSDGITVRKKLQSLQQLQHVQDRGQSFSRARDKHRESASKLKKATQPLKMTAENQDMVREMLQSLHSIEEDNMAFSENETSEEDEAEVEFDEQPKRKTQNKVDSKNKVKYKGNAEIGFKMQNKQQDKAWTSTQNFYPKREEKCLGICSNPLNDFREKQYQNMQLERQKLPAWDMKEEVVQTIEDHQVVIICGMTGCGKTTQVPQFILEDAQQHEDLDVNIVCTQPRRISATAVAQRVAEERVEELGTTVGYQIRLESAMSSLTRLLFCTMGVVLRRLQSDSQLMGVTHIIIDEVHERSEESDFLLMILRDMLEERPDLKVILMSATINAELFSSYFGGCPVLEIPGQSYEVEQLFLEDAIEHCGYITEGGAPYCRPERLGNSRPKQTDRDRRGISQPPSDKVPDMKLDKDQLRLRYPYYSRKCIKTLSMLDLEQINYDLIVHLLEWIVTDMPLSGAILVFMPGLAEIETLYNMLLATSEFGTKNKAKYNIKPLHSSLSSEEQKSVLLKMPEGVTKIVIATNIAESSITIDDIVYVVDAGRMKQMRYDQAKGIHSLETIWVSKANAEQRKGRAGRVQDGVCYHLFTSHHFYCHLSKQPVPEVQRVCLQQLVLRTKMLPMFASHQDVKPILKKLIDAPKTEAIHGAVKGLTELGALDKHGEITPLGCQVGNLPVDVRIGKLILYGAIFRCLDSALTIAACLSDKSPFVSPFEKRTEADEKKREFAKCNSDYLAMVNAYNGWIAAKKIGFHVARVYCKENFLSQKTLQNLASSKQQYVELLSEIKFIRPGIRVRHVQSAARKGSDGVVEITGPEANENSSNWELVSGMLVAALDPNIIKVNIRNPKFHASHSETGVQDCQAKDLGFIIKFDVQVAIHPVSTNFKVCYYPSPFLVYHEKVKTKKLYIRDSSMVSAYPLLLFCGGGMSYDGNVLSVDDGWIQFQALSPKVAELVLFLRKEKDQLLNDKMSNPKMNLSTCPRGSKIINCIVKLLSSEGGDV